MATVKKTRKKKPSAAQLRARKRFVAMVRARAKAAKAKKKATKKATAKRRPAIKRTVKRAATKKRARVTVTVKNGVKKPKFKVGAKVYSYQNESYKAPIVMIRLSDDPAYAHKYKLQLKGHQSNWIDEQSLSRTKKNPVKRGMRQQAAAKRRHAKELEKQGYKVTLTRSAQPGLQAGIRIKRAQRAGKPGFPWPKKNGGATLARKRRQEFVGRPSKKTLSMYAPRGSGASGTVVAMGKLKKLHIKGRTPLDFKGSALLAHNPKTDQMYILGRNYSLKHLRKNPSTSGLEDIGEVTRIEYEATKTHLGDKGPVTYYHRLGEEGGKRPHALINEENLLILEGGDYYIRPEGIRN